MTKAARKWALALDAVKAREADDGSRLVELADDLPLARVVVAWGRIAPPRRLTAHERRQAGAKARQPTDPDDFLRWAWQTVEAPVRAVSDATGMSFAEVRVLLARAAAAGLIYPDGERHPLAVQFVEAMMLRKLRDMAAE